MLILEKIVDKNTQKQIEQTAYLTVNALGINYPNLSSRELEKFEDRIKYELALLYLENGQNKNKSQA